MSLDAENWLFGVEDTCPGCEERSGDPRFLCDDCRAILNDEESDPMRLAKGEE